MESKQDSDNYMIRGHEVYDIKRRLTYNTLDRFSLVEDGLTWEVFTPQQKQRLVDAFISLKANKLQMYKNKIKQSMEG